MDGILDFFWGNFIPGFCKVEFLCYEAEPNWMGWILLGWAGLMALGLCFAMIAAMFD